MPTLADIAAMLSAPAPPDARRNVTGIATLEEAGDSDLSFLGSEAYLPQFESTDAAAIIVQRRVKLPAAHSKTVFVVDDADLAVAKVLMLFAPPIQKPPMGIDATARIEPTAQVGPGHSIGPNVVIGQRTKLGARCAIHAGVVIGDDVTLGDDCVIYPNVVIRERITIGHRVIVQAGSVIGTDGFGYRWDGKQHQKIPQIGTIIIEDDVEIGSCVCIDRAKFSSTRIGRGTKIDNLVQVGHNTQIGPHCIITGQVGLAGSVQLGAGVVLGGQCAVRDHVKIGDGSMVAGCAGVAENVEAKMVVSGMPALPHRQSLREQAALRHLPDLKNQVKKLQDELDLIKSQLGRT